MAPTGKRAKMLTLLVVPAVGAAVLAAGLSIAISAGALGGDPVTGEALREPPVLRAKDGKLSVTLNAKQSITTLGGRSIQTPAVYNGSIPGPTLIVRPGDHLQILSKNGLTQPTNLHTHGLHVSPKGHGDNVFINTPPGATFTNEYEIPKDHIPGVYWYHPHRHMYVNDQVVGGMAGAIIVEGAAESLPEIKDARRRVMIFEQFQVGSDGVLVPFGEKNPAPVNTYINGQLQPVIDIRPGEIQIWRLLNLNGDAFLRLQIPVGLEAWLAASDGTPLNRVRGVRSMLLAPAARRTILVRAKATGDIALNSIDWGAGLQFAKGAQMATVRVAGARRADQQLPGKVFDMPDLRGEPVAAKRTVQFSIEPQPAPDPPQFLINGMNYDSWGKTNLAKMKLNTVEEWTLTNTSSEYHPFHIHIQPFQVISINGVPEKGLTYRDTVAIPPAVDGVPGQVVIRQRYTDFTGRFVIHCHILFHEDHGMMAPVEVVK